ncbi:hypothetical protein LTR37_016588 [Vermiconidia calcicola]|uniref:Uncharacterized protein n=1 Tax=Vermiconidia calcicola TaxID=1690605 RepID=A0ACC3MM90_9PEZI|nr:hypothetical protein LTR37_016588 [Vermiconidia calcicola]
MVGSLKQQPSPMCTHVKSISHLTDSPTPLTILNVSGQTEMAGSEAAQQQQSRLMTLPSELRNRVYDYVFAKGDREVRKRQCFRLYSTPNFLALLHTCRRIHNEAMAIPYHSNYIHCTDTNTLFDCMTDLRDEKMNAITRVTVAPEYSTSVADLCKLLKMLRVVSFVKNLRTEASMWSLPDMSNHSKCAILAAIRCLKGLHSLDAVVVDSRFSSSREEYYPGDSKTAETDTVCSEPVAKAYKVADEWKAAAILIDGSGPL